MQLKKKFLAISLLATLTGQQHSLVILLQMGHFQTGDVPICILDQSKAVSTKWKEERWRPVLPCLLIMTRTRAVDVQLEPNCLFSLAIVHKHITLAPSCSWTNEVYKCCYSANVRYHHINVLNTISSVTKTGLAWDATCGFVKKTAVSCCIPTQVLLLAACLAASRFLAGVWRSVIYTEVFDVIMRPWLAAKV